MCEHVTRMLRFGGLRPTAGCQHGPATAGRRVGGLCAALAGSSDPCPQGAHLCIACGGQAEMGARARWCVLHCCSGVLGCAHSVPWRHECWWVFQGWWQLHRHGMLEEHCALPRLWYRERALRALGAVEEEYFTWNELQDAGLR